MARSLVVGILFAHATAELAASYRKDAFLPCNLYPEARIPDPTSGGRIHVIGTSLGPCPSTSAASVYVDGELVDVSPNSTQPPAEWAFDWLRVEPPAITGAGEPVWVSFHSRQPVWDSRTSASIAVVCGSFVVFNGTFPVAVPVVAVTWVTLTNDTSNASVVVLNVKHQDANATAQTAQQVLLNGVDVTDSIPEAQRVIPVSQGAMWIIPSATVRSTNTVPGAVWTVAVSWEDPASPVTAAGGNLWRPFFPVEAWPYSDDCPYPGANTSNYIVHRSHGINTFFIDHNPAKDTGPGCSSGPTALQIFNSVSVENNFWTLASFQYFTPDQIVNYSNVAGWFLADEDDQSIGPNVRHDAASTAELHSRTPGIPTYQGGSRNRYSGTFAGSSDIKGLDFYIGACAPHVTEWGSKQLLRGSYDYLRNARNNHMPGPTWFYSQAFDDSWNAFHGRVDRQLDTAEIAVSIMSVVAAGAKGLMFFLTEISYTLGETAQTWAALGALSREIAALSELYRGGDVTENAVAKTSNGAYDSDVIVEATLAPQGIVITLINIANDGGYADLPCGVGEVQHWKITPHVIDSVTVAVPAGTCIVDAFELVNATIIAGPGNVSVCGPTTYTLRNVALAQSWPGVTRTLVLATTASLRASVEAALMPWVPPAAILL